MKTRENLLEKLELIFFKFKGTKNNKGNVKKWKNVIILQQLWKNKIRWWTSFKRTKKNQNVLKDYDEDEMNRRNLKQIQERYMRICKKCEQIWK